MHNVRKSTTVYLIALIGVLFLNTSCRGLFPWDESKSVASSGKHVLTHHDKPANKPVAKTATKPTTTVKVDKFVPAPIAETTESRHPESFAQPSRNIEVTPAPFVDVKKTATKTFKEIIKKPVQTPKIAAVEMKVPPLAIDPKPVKVLPLPKEAPPSPPILMAKKLKDPVQVVPKINPGLLRVNGRGTNRIIEASGREVEIASSEGVLIISGGCKVLTVTGDSNQVQCDSADEVVVKGRNNTVILGIIGTALISGDQNLVSWGSGVNNDTPIVQVTGAENHVERLE